jgi:hypothetical protein
MVCTLPLGFGGVDPFLGLVILSVVCGEVIVVSDGVVIGSIWSSAEATGAIRPLPGLINWTVGLGGCISSRGGLPTSGEVLSVGGTESGGM